MRWQHSFVGRRKAHAYNLEHIVHILSQSADSTSTKITALDEMTGATKSELEIPPSLEEWINLKQTGKVIACSTESSSKSFPTSTSRLFVNPDGYAYVAFTLSKRTVTSLKCRGESAILPENVGVKRDDRVILWQIHSDGTYRSTVVEQFKEEQSLASPAHVASPTGAIIPDGPHGVLLSMRWIQSVNGTVAHESQDEYIYRIDENGQVVYKLLLPKYGGPLHDEMVLGENDIGFATRGSVLIAFNVRLGKEMWRWESNKASISVFAALKEGHCLVQTPDAIVEVSNSHRSREVIKGKAMIGWDGQLYLKHN